MNYNTLTIWQALETELSFHAPISSEFFTRLAEVDLIDHVDPEIDVRLEAGPDSEHKTSVRGTIKATVHLICQRCLEPFAYPIVLDFRWIPVQSEYEADKIDEDEVVLIIEEDDPQELLYHLEDEILLALPVIPYHDEETYCAGREFIKNQKVIEEERKFPFAGLADLLEK
ncbi:YceD family protein [Ignatzschineria sp. RMDPL8A]|uniref:YceD family protein n=1 Tax=Ignatzschineria sp. RMDPL8A TaxID=2999236 RepID=UPI0016B8DBB9|nr:YceD family protein [Ignatzschineria sp. RMDPL8A]MDG9728957.1 YceD family protein [Ignatzschineria sp. RMDPL8A]NLD09756.1 hypothetical protein [Xanthomonadaceae bacterium]